MKKATVILVRKFTSMSVVVVEDIGRKEITIHVRGA